MVIVRYEDIVSSFSYLQPVFDFCNVKIDDVDHNYFHQKSVLKWKNDKFFGFVLSGEVIALAQSYGYQKEELINRSALIWPIYREFARVSHKSTKPLKKITLEDVKGIKALIGT